MPGPSRHARPDRPSIITGPLPSCPAPTGHLPHSLKSLNSLSRCRVRVSLISYLLQYPCECCPFLKTFSCICGVIRFLPSGITYCESVFRKSYTENVEVFKTSRTMRNNTHFRIDTCGRAFSSCPDIPYLSECGVLCRLFLVRSFHNRHRYVTDICSAR